MPSGLRRIRSRLGAAMKQALDAVAGRVVTVLLKLMRRIDRRRASDAIAWLTRTFGPLLREHATVEAVKRHFAGIIKGDVLRYELPGLSALQFVGHDALGGGVTTSLALDAHGKSLSSALLQMEIEVEG